MSHKVDVKIWFSFKLLQRSPGEPVDGEAPHQPLTKNHSDREHDSVQGMLWS